MMPLSKARNRERMRTTRLHKRLSSLTESKPVQPEYIERPAIIMLKVEDVPSVITTSTADEVWIDADGNQIYDDEE